MRGGAVLKALVEAPGLSGPAGQAGAPPASADPATPKAALVLFVGGDGKLGMTDSGDVTEHGQNFLARSAGLFVERGLATVLIDQPSDAASEGYRTSEAQARDAALVVDYLRGRWRIPVVFVGTSRGTISAASAAARLGRLGPDALALTSSVMRHNKRGAASVYSAGLESIAIPTLIVHNKGDGCPLCPVSDTPRLQSALTGAARSEIILMSGGGGAGDPCEALSAHGYSGIEKETVSAISAWILDPNRGPDRPRQ
ncbi:MAG: alpha/beta hydrolase [Desulfovibrionaceae bacterium]|nr:alpha/beta hydrolase [Desulfovibrionaceae bacterium]